MPPTRFLWREPEANTEGSITKARQAHLDGARLAIYGAGRCRPTVKRIVQLIWGFSSSLYF